MIRPLRIAQVAPPMEQVPPEAYGGTERIVFELVTELTRRGHDVTTFAPGDSSVSGSLVATVPRALRPAGHGGDVGGYVLATILKVLDRQADFDIIHSHLDWYGLALRRATRTPVVSTFHGRLDLPWSRDVLADRPDGLVAISESQASVHPDVPWTVIHNGLTLDSAPFERHRSDALVFVGRVTPEKGIVDAIKIAERADRPLKIAAKVGPTPAEQAFNEQVFEPALKAAGKRVEFLGELSGADRDMLFARSHAVLMPGSWPEPFGLVAIEALACGAPVIARRVGGLEEIIRDGVDGFFGDDVTEMAFMVERVADLDRDAIRASVIDRFSASRMADGYEELYARMLGLGRGSGGAGGRRIVEIATRPRPEPLQATESVATAESSEATPA
ncbi:MAG TPA: glycosyltransferase family 4 protein [Candidatus Limnocylindrales bacterium]|nr:glycosyltransferase family 4 protein [Candidatus Limnocylindrales bacterium]